MAARKAGKAERTNGCLGIDTRIYDIVHQYNRYHNFIVCQDSATLTDWLEYLRADTNQTLGESVRGYEQDEAYRFDRVVREIDDEMKDPDDVFFEARDRKEAIREKMKELQSGLNRNRPKRKGRKGKKAKKKRPKKTG